MGSYLARRSEVRIAIVMRFYESISGTSNPSFCYLVPWVRRT